MNNEKEKAAQPFTGLPEKVFDLDANNWLAASNAVLVVEDDESLAQAMREYLESYGYHVDCANDGVEGIKKIMVNDYAVIVCDLVMPNLAGDMFYKGVERVKPHLCKRFVFITGYKDNSKTDEFLRSINGLVLWKPFRFHVLMENIQAIMAKTKN